LPLAPEKQLKGWRREKKLKLIRAINPEFKDLAQTWGCVPQQTLFSGFVLEKLRAHG